MPYKDKDKQNEYQRNRLAERRRKWLKDKKCISCGSRKNLELDHINPKEKISHRIWSWAAKRMLKELTKCQVLCRSCHQIKTNKYFGWLKHGTPSMHTRCHCVECRRASRDAKRRWRKRTGKT